MCGVHRSLAHLLISRVLPSMTVLTLSGCVQHSQNINVLWSSCASQWSVVAAVCTELKDKLNPKTLHSHCISQTPFALNSLPFLYFGCIKAKAKQKKIPTQTPNKQTKSQKKQIYYITMLSPIYYSPNMHPSIYSKKCCSVKAFLNYQPDCASILACFTTHFSSL